MGVWGGAVRGRPEPRAIIPNQSQIIMSFILFILSSRSFGVCQAIYLYSYLTIDIRKYAGS